MCIGVGMGGDGGEVFFADSGNRVVRRVRGGVDGETVRETLNPKHQSLQPWTLYPVGSLSFYCPKP
jgi:hypothetical protein